MALRGGLGREWDYGEREMSREWIVVSGRWERVVIRGFGRGDRW